MGRLSSSFHQLMAERALENMRIDLLPNPSGKLWGQEIMSTHACCSTGTARPAFALAADFRLVVVGHVTAPNRLAAGGRAARLA
jgi:hypothetical protein